jgi:ribosomal protein S6
MQYELFYLIGEAKESELPKIKEGVTKAVENEGGKWLETEIIEKRKMAYAVKGQYRGIYVARRFELPAKDAEDRKEDAVKNISRQMKLNPEILRFLIINAAELPELKPHEIIAGARPSQSAPRRREFAPARPVSAKLEETKKTPEKTKETKSIDDKLEEILNI